MPTINPYWEVGTSGDETYGILKVINGGTGLDDSGTAGNVLTSDGNGNWYSVSSSIFSITALPSASQSYGTDLIPVSETGITKSLTVNQLFTAPVQQSYEDFTAITDPSAPSSGIVRVYAKNIAGKILPKWLGPTGKNAQFQAGLDSKTVVMWLPGTSPAINFGTTWAVTATQAIPNINSTNVMTSIVRNTFTTTTAINNISGVRSGNPVAISSTTPGIGGFFFAARFGILTYVSTMQVLVGLISNNGAFTGDPSSQQSIIAATKDSNETVWQCTTTNGSTFEKTSSGASTGAGGASGVFDFYAFQPSGGNGAVTLRLVDIATNTIYVDNVTHSTYTPVDTTALYVDAQTCISVGGTAAAIFLSKIYIECDN